MSSFIRVPTGLEESQNGLTLCILLEDRNGCAYLVRLWMWCAHQAPSGRFEKKWGGSPSGILERVAKWEGKPGRLVDALLETGFVRDEGGALIVDMTESLGNREPTNNPEALIYFVQRGTSGPIKIGFSRQLGARITSLQTSSAEPLYLRATIPGARELEKSLHRMFAHLRLAGEWFEPGEDLLAHIRKSNAGDEEGD